MNISYIFTRSAKYEGVRPINIYLLRLFYFLMFALIGSQSWTEIFTHQGPWDHVRAVAWCVWAAYTTMAFFGLIHPLRMLPIMIFMVFYKTLWLFVVAYPLWKAGTLATSPANEMTHVFIWAPLIALIIPWGYAYRTFVKPSRHKATAAA